MRLRLALLLAVLLVAAWLRIGGIGVQSLRGDEAFTARYWTATLAELTATDGLAWREPHPFGAFLAFGAWVRLAGNSEIALRTLPALLNLLGAAAVYAAARRLFRPERAVQIGVIAALLWACNPYLIWHSQDARNYALWSGVSAVALWLLIRAAERGTRRAWLLYAGVEIAALYLFFLEGLLLALHGLYMLLVRRRALRGWLLALGVILIAQIPNVIQAVALANSGYSGTRGSAEITSLPNFWAVLLLGELGAPAFGASVLIMLLIGLLCLPQRLRAYFAAALILPLAALYLVSTRLNVFDPRYILAVVPFGVLVLACVAARRRAAFSLALAALLIGVQLWALLPYRAPDYRKAADWRTWAAFLGAQTSAADTLIVTPADPASGATDPVIGYYYTQPARVLVLPYPNADTEAFVQAALAESRAVWFTPTGSRGEAVLAALARFGVLEGEFTVGQSFRVWRYRKR